MSASSIRGSLLVPALAALILVSGCNKKPDEAFEVFATPPALAQLARYWQIPEFTLTERTGATVTHSTLRGRIWVADFFYTTCPGPCPMLTSRLSEIHKKIRLLDDVALVSISTDPLKDTPAVLTQYAQKFGADEKWLFLTGEKTAIFELANKGFKLSVTEDPGNLKEPVTHSTKLVLVDRNGTVRGFYDGLTPEQTERLVVDIETLRKETR